MFAERDAAAGVLMSNMRRCIFDLCWGKNKTSVDLVYA
jgi:hypothetical protein